MQRRLESNSTVCIQTHFTALNSTVLSERNLKCQKGGRNIQRTKAALNHQVFHVHHDEIRKMPFSVYSLRFLINYCNKILSKY